jgi:hypothetical protein
VVLFFVYPFFINTNVITAAKKGTLEKWKFADFVIIKEYPYSRNIGKWPIGI